LKYIIWEIYRAVISESNILFIIVYVFPLRKFIALHIRNAKMILKIIEKTNPVKSNVLDVDRRNIISKTKKTAQKNI